MQGLLMFLAIHPIQSKIVIFKKTCRAVPGTALQSSESRDERRSWYRCCFPHARKRTERSTRAVPYNRLSCRVRRSFSNQLCRPYPARSKAPYPKLVDIVPGSGLAAILFFLTNVKKSRFCSQLDSLDNFFIHLMVSLVRIKERIYSTGQKKRKPCQLDTALLPMGGSPIDESLETEIFQASSSHRHLHTQAINRHSS